MDIVTHQNEFCKELLINIPKRLHKMFTFAFFTYSIEHIVSMRGNARKFVENAYTAKSKAWRFLKNDNLRELLPHLLSVCDIVGKESIVAIDFSTFKKWQVLMFAIQTRKGRAIPIFFKIITYPIEKDSQNMFIINAIEEFVELIGFRPKLVFDRGFACPSIIQHLAKNKHIFYIRIKGGKHVEIEGEDSCQVRDVVENDALVSAYDSSLRLITSNSPNNGNEPWYLITNDKRSSRKTIIDYYYFRFEIEEFFKDAKWIQGLEFMKFEKIESVTTLLWFVLIGWWCMVGLSDKIRSFSIFVPKAKACISEFRHLLETITLFKNSLVLAHLGYDSL